MKKILGIIGSALTVMMAMSCDGGKTTENPTLKKPLPLVQVAKAEQRDFSRVLTYTGSVEPVRIARMASPAEGPIVECNVREGDRVVKNQILARVGRNRIVETGLDAAREELRRQQSDYNRVEQLVTSGALAAEQLDVSRSNLKRAEAQVAAMETGADDYAITAPWDGVVSRVWISEGNYVSPRANLVEMYDPESLIIRISVPEQNVLALEPDQTVELTLDAYPGQRYAGTVIRIYPELDRSTRTVMVEISLAEKIRLLSGMFARVEVAVQTLKDAIVIPESALVVLPNGENIAFVLENDKVSRRIIETIMGAGGFVAIGSGIRTDEMVVTFGNDALRDGSEVKVMDTRKKNDKGTSGGKSDSTQLGKTTETGEKAL